MKLRSTIPTRLARVNVTGMLRRKVFLFGALAFSFSAIVFACSEESPILVVGPDSGEGGSSGSTSSGSSGTSSSGGDDGQADGPITITDGGIVDAPDPDVIVKDTGAGVVDAAGCTTCDCDFDGVNRPACGDDAGTDCDDNDTRYHTGQGFIDMKPDQGKTGNWNCSASGVEKFYATNVNCGLVGLGNCTGAQGFTGDPGCGEDGQYVTCKTVLLGILLCQTDKTETRKQACR
jgi:hypothetical protein